MNIFFFDREGSTCDANAAEAEPRTSALRELFLSIARSGVHQARYVPVDEAVISSYPHDARPFLLIAHPQPMGDFAPAALANSFLANDENAHLLLVSSNPQSIGACGHERAHISPLSYEQIQVQQIIDLAHSIEAGVPDWQAIGPVSDPSALIAYHLLSVTGKLSALPTEDLRALKEAALAAVRTVEPDAGLEAVAKHLALGDSPRPADSRPADGSA